MSTSYPIGLTPLEHFRPLPGQRVILLSPGCAAAACAQPRPMWTELDRLRHARERLGDALCLVAVPEGLDEASVLALCRAAHEVWLLEGETGRVSQWLWTFRTQSAPPVLNERRSVLHAPEVGVVRRWSAGPKGMVEQLDNQPDKPLAPDAVRHMQALCRLLQRLPAQTPDDWAAMAKSLRTHAANRQRWVRWTLAGIFAMTVVGAIGLQMLSMSPWGIPMADLYAVFYLAVGSLYLWGKRQQWNTEQLAWTSLAEALEGQVLLGQAGLRQGVITGLFMLRHRRSVEWIREALRPMTWAQYTQHGTPSASSHALLTTWVPRALSHHDATARQQRRKSLALTWGMRACYAVGGVLTVIAVTDWITSQAISTALSIGIGLASATGTLMLIFNGVLGFGEDAGLHAHLAGVFRHAHRCLEQPLLPHEYDELLLDLVQESVQQAAERVLLAVA